ncbi:DNA translocase FtsK [Granulicella sp. 5B5]|uniref:DNA translocase FtsK n=1 Tax=Granulicella sp. 5B5 TaxID=1617967 RepID=UPI0015F5F75D|nr:DNA translocase FtsK [Granulicella sp. 5B5]QMV19247.1 DNA translocase FtsK [Granulicella sp. 5B5]
MKPNRLSIAPTRNRRLNEMLGLVVIVVAGLLLLSLLTYTPSDPSLDSVSSVAGPHAVHNWAGAFGAYLSDLLLQSLGIAVAFIPVVLLSIGISWLRSRPVGSGMSRLSGLLLWLVFAPATIALLPFSLHYKHAVPIAGLEGRLLCDALVKNLNLPGTTILCGLMVLLSLYLATSFTLTNAREWFASHFGFLSILSNGIATRRQRHQEANVDGAFASYQPSAAPAPEEPAQATANGSILSSFFHWFGRRKREVEELMEDETPTATEPPSMWETMPRTHVDAADAAGINVAAAAVAPYSAELAAAAAPIRTSGELPFVAQQQQDDWLNAPERHTPAPILPKPQLVPKPVPAQSMPAMPSPTANIRDQNIAFGERADANQLAVTILPKSIRGYKLPPSSLLYHSEEHAQVREDELRAEARVLVEKCAEFGVDGNVEQINPGPVVTTFEFRPDAGVKYARVTGLADDLCLAMAAESILIERMPGKSTVGIQVPNRERETIWLRDVVECESFAQSKSRLAIALGKDISGRIVTGDLASMPHVLIAGSTGSGKSVAINAMIMSVLYKSTPEQVRMILVDPKRVELGMYEGIPHLFTPIITEAKLAANALRNAVREMERRLKLLAANHVRNIDQFNKLFDHGSEYLFEDVNQEPLPYIMIVIDELADLMMLDRANVEEAITRLAQMARAVGIHLVLATQRPSVDVITGLIKANVPTRMSFRLATKVDSRTIIDSNGAESLLGRGDMLFLPPGTSRLQRVHAPFVTEKEIAAVTEFWRAQGQAEYVEGFLEGPKDEKGSGEGGSANDGDDNDPMFDDAVRLVFEFGKASTSLLQRRLRIGYGRAAHLIDLMERDGLVGPADGSKPREILKAPTYYSEVDAALR